MRTPASLLFTVILIHSSVPLPVGASSTRISHPPIAVITRSPYLNSDKGLGAFLDTLQNDRPDFLYPTVVCDPILEACALAWCHSC